MFFGSNEIGIGEIRVYGDGEGGVITIRALEEWETRRDAATLKKGPPLSRPRETLSTPVQRSMERTLDADGEG